MAGAGDGTDYGLGIPIIGAVLVELEERRERRLLEGVVLPPAIQTFDLTKGNLGKFAAEVFRLFGSKILAAYTKRDGEKIWRPHWRSLSLRDIGAGPEEERLRLNFYPDTHDVPALYTFDLNLEPRFAFLPNKTYFEPRGFYVSQGNQTENPWLSRLEVAYIVKPEQK